MNTEPAEAAVLDLDTTLIGELLTRLPAIAAQLRHGGLVSTLSYIVDRLTYNAHIIETGTQSFRLAQTRARAESG